MKTGSRLNLAHGLKFADPALGDVHWTGSFAQIATVLHIH